MEHGKTIGQNMERPYDIKEHGKTIGHQGTTLKTYLMGPLRKLFRQTGIVKLD